MDQVQISLTKEGYCNNVHLFTTKAEQKDLLFDSKTRNATKVLALLTSTKLEELGLYPKEWIALYSVYCFAKSLVMTQTYMPRLLEVGIKYRIPWIPADINSDVRKAQATGNKKCIGSSLIIRRNLGREN